MRFIYTATKLFTQSFSTKKSHLIGLCALLASNTAFVTAQQKPIDSLFAVLQHAKEDTAKVNTLNTLSWDLYIQAKYKTADSLARTALELATTLDYKMGQGVAYKNIGNIYTDLGKYPEALSNQQKAFDIFEQIGFKQGIGRVYNNIGLINAFQNNYADALENYIKALKIFNEINYNQGKALLYGNFGNLYLLKGSYEEALNNETDALALDQRAGFKHGIAADYRSIGNIYFAQGKYDNALTNYLTSLQICREINDLENMGNAYRSVGRSYLYQKQYKQAGQYLDSALSLSKQLNQLKVTVETFYSKTQLDSAQQDYKTAFGNYKNYTLYRDSIQNEESNRKLLSEQIKNYFDRKEAKQKAEQDRLNLIAEADKKRQSLITVSISISLLLSLIFSVFSFNRYKLIQQQKKHIEDQKSEVELQKMLVDEKNKDITDSIHYASRIQRALLTTNEYLSTHIKDYFILFRPRNIVSGDFYWANEMQTEKGKRFLICVGDCTGHGVPGAFMSLLNISLLNEANIEKGIDSPEKILDFVRKQIIHSLNPQGTYDLMQDGMDCVLCSFDFSANTIEFACANNPLWVVRNGELLVYNADKMPVGLHYETQPGFTLQTTTLQKGDTVYLTTDGYADQFGGPTGKKFKSKFLKEKLLSIAHLSLEQQKAELDSTIEKWKGELEQMDDVLILGVRI